MSSDLKSNRITSTGSVFGGPARVKAIYMASAATAGTVVLTNGNGGATIASLDTPASAADPVYLVFPEGGLLFPTSVYATITNTTSITVFYA